MKLVIEVDIITDVPTPAEAEFAKRVVQNLSRNLDGNSLIEEALDAGALYGTVAAPGIRSIRVEGDPVIYGERGRA